VKVRNNIKGTPQVEHIAPLRKLPELVYNMEKYLERRVGVSDRERKS
jgi:hypothetical protein